MRTPTLRRAGNGSRRLAAFWMSSLSGEFILGDQSIKPVQIVRNTAAAARRTVRRNVPAFIALCAAFRGHTVESDRVRGMITGFVVGLG
jgi:hypothetical protein